MRILVTAYDYRPRLGGIATCAYETVRALAGIEDVHVRLLAAHTSDKQLDAKFDRHGCFETRRLNLSSRAAASIPQFIGHLSQEIVTWEPHAILNFLWMPCGVATRMLTPLLWAKGIPYFVFAHGVEVVETNSTLKKKVRSQLSWIKNLAFSGASAVFPVSHFTASKIEQDCRVPQSRICTIHNGVDANLFTRSSKPQDLVEKYSLKGKTVFMTVSRLEDYKGVDQAILALEKVTKVNQNVTYLIAGEGPARHRLEQMVAALSLNDYVKFVGAVPAGRLNDYYNVCDVFVLLSRYDAITPNFEGFGIVFLEAAACGKPSIAGNSGGIPDAVVDHQTGWLVPPTDPDFISEVMLKACSDKELVQRLGINAYNRARADFGWDKVAEKILREMRRHVRD